MRKSEALMATKQVVEALVSKGNEVLDYESIKEFPFDPTHIIPEGTKTAIVIYMGNRPDP